MVLGSKVQGWITDQSPEPVLVMSAEILTLHLNTWTKAAGS